MYRKNNITSKNIREKEMSWSDKWKKKEDRKYINLYSKGGVVIMTLAFLGIMYIINLVAYTVGNLLRW